ncbi:MAG: hypothetical protein MI810_18445 [Flavobacteriales bacterium]|nr:hypothetical protein [Flavobacteriales bacterium]
MKKLDKAIYGVLFGAILPIIGFLLSYVVKNRGGAVDFQTYVEMTLNPSIDQQDILIFCIIPNMFFFYFTNFRWKMYEMTKGLVAVTLLLGLALFIITY